MLFAIWIASGEGKSCITKWKEAMITACWRSIDPMDRVGATRHPYNANREEIRLTRAISLLTIMASGRARPHKVRIHNEFAASHTVLTMVALSHSADNADTVSGLIRG